jgi:hypothetical protein
MLGPLFVVADDNANNIHGDGCAHPAAPENAHDDDDDDDMRRFMYEVAVSYRTVLYRISCAASLAAPLHHAAAATTTEFFLSKKEFRTRVSTARCDVATSPAMMRTMFLISHLPGCWYEA